MSTSCMQAQAIKQQLEDMPLEEFEDLLKGVTAVNKGHEGMPQHAELLSQLKHHVKVPPDEPFPRKPSGDKDCPKFLLNGNKGNSDGECSNLNGNISGGSANRNLSFGPHKNSPLYTSSSASRFFPGGDQNANNPLSSTSDAPIPPYSSHQPPNKSPQLKGYNNHYQNHHHNNLSCGNSLDGDPDDDDDQDVEDHPMEYTGTLPTPYIINSDTKLKDLPSLFPNKNSGSLASCGTSQALVTGSSNSTESPATSSASWDLQTTASPHLQLNDGYKSVSSVTSGASSYMGRSLTSNNDGVVGTVRSVSPTLPPGPTSGVISKSPSLEGSQFDKQTGRRTGDRKKKSSKNVLRETLIHPEDIPGYKGNDDIDKLLEFVEGNQTKTKKPQKEKKRDPKPKGNEKQMLSKAASLDENSLGYGSKKGDESMSRNRNSKDIEKKNSTNITKSSTAICSVDIADSNKTISSEPGIVEGVNALKISNPPAPLVNGSPPASVISKSIAAKATTPSSEKSSGTPKSQTVTGKTEKSQRPEVISNLKSESQDINEPKRNVSTPIKTEEEKQSKPDESDGPYVLVQSKKKKEKKKHQQRESENFARSHVDQARREGGRGRRSNTERRKSVGSVPGSENDECSDDDDSVRSLPAGECTPRERIPKPCSSSGGTPQTSYADIARMSRDENGKAPQSSPVSLLPTTTKSPSAAKSPIVAKSPISTVKSPSVPVTVNSDSNFPALSPQNSSEKIAPVGAAVWPCRQRQDQDPMSKEKSPINSKSDDSPKEGASPIASPPQMNSANSIPPKCSTKLLFETTETCSQDKTPVEKISPKDTPLTSTLSESSSIEPEQAKEPVPIKCNGTAPPTSSCVENEHLIHSTVGKCIGNRKSDDKRSKERNNVYEEVLAKSNPHKATENGDTVTEPVVFCGGTFDRSSLPVGQKIGFEFGFGVIEALNDNNGLTESSMAEPSSVDFPPISAISVKGTKEKPEQIRSQDRVANIPESTMESQSVKKDQVPRSVEKQSNKNCSIKPKAVSHTVFQASDIISLDHGASGDSSFISSQPTKQQEVSDIKTAPPSVESSPPPQPALQRSVSKMEKLAEPTSKVDNHEGKKPADAGIAQIYMPPTQTSVPDSVHQAHDFMNNYAARLTNLSKEGKVSYYRIV